MEKMGGFKQTVRRGKNDLGEDRGKRGITSISGFFLRQVQEKGVDTGGLRRSLPHLGGTRREGGGIVALGRRDRANRVSTK